MPPTIILIRHGQALHNVTRESDLPDPELTDEGRAQCARLHEHLQADLTLADQIDTIITSPFRRTLQTTQLGLDWLIQRGIPVEIDALWQGPFRPICRPFSSSPEVFLSLPLTLQPSIGSINLDE